MQLDIAGGHYVNGAPGATHAGGEHFTLYALLNPGDNEELKNALLQDTFAVVTTLLPLPGDNSPNLGSFEFAGQTINVPGLVPFSIQFPFTFDPQHFTTSYDAPTDPFPLAHNYLTDIVNGGMYYAPFIVDTTNLNNLYDLHFHLIDLTSPSYEALNDHDAQSINGGVNPIPEPASVLLLASGLAGLEILRRRKKAKKR